VYLTINVPGFVIGIFCTLIAAAVIIVVRRVLK
jgi:hypothetical protein